MLYMDIYSYMLYMSMHVYSYIYIYVYVYVPSWVHDTTCMPGACGDQRDPLVLELQVIVSCLLWELGSKFRCSRGVVSSLSHGAISPTPAHWLLKQLLSRELWFLNTALIWNNKSSQSVGNGGELDCSMLAIYTLTDWMLNCSVHTSTCWLDPF